MNFIIGDIKTTVYDQDGNVIEGNIPIERTNITDAIKKHTAFAKKINQIQFDTLNIKQNQI